MISKIIYLYFLLKPYYIFSSGSIQISDVFVIIALFVFCFKLIKDKELFNEIYQKTKLINIFVAFVIYISLFYSALYFRTDFIKSAMFYVFNLIAIWILYVCIKDKKFLNNTNKILMLNIFIQFILYIFKIGKWYGKVRYMGTFNDPNQFAFFVFSSMIISFIIEQNLGKKTNYIFYLVSMFLIYESGSTGMILGTIIFIFGELGYLLLKLKNKKIIIVMLTLIPIFYTLSLLIDTSQIYEDYVQNNIVIERIKEKVKRIDKDEGNLFQERGYDKILKYPEKILLGAGHGYNERYKTYHTGEIHATLPSMLFYYGIVPFMILLIWIYRNVKYVPLNIKMAYIAVLIESFTLLNQRQVLFWFMIILGGIYEAKSINYNTSV